MFVAVVLVPFTSDNNEDTRQPNLTKVEFCCSEIFSDPGLCKQIADYPFQIRDHVKTKKGIYELRDPTQPVGFSFLRIWQSGEWRAFKQHWFEIGMKAVGNSRENPLTTFVLHDESKMQHFACLVTFSLVN